MLAPSIFTSATGIIVGEAALWLPDAYPLVRIGFATFSAIAIAALYGLGAVVPIQAGVSAVLMLAVGPESAGVVRMLDVVVGSCVGLIFSDEGMEEVAVITAGTREDNVALATARRASRKASNPPGCTISYLIRL